MHREEFPSLLTGATRSETFSTDVHESTKARDKRIWQEVKDSDFWGAPLTKEDTRLRSIERSDAANKRSTLNRVCLSRFRRIWWIGFQGCGCGNANGWIFIACVATSVFATLLTLAVFFASTYISNAINNHDQQMFTIILIGVFSSVIVGALLNAVSNSLNSYLALRVRRTITRHIHYRYLQQKTYYMLNNMDRRVDNPDQRIADDVNFWSTAITTFLSVGRGLLPLFFSTLIQTGTSLSTLGLGGMGVVYGFFLLAAVVTRALTNIVVPMLFRQDRLEGDFRFAEVHLRSNAESVAFYGGEVQQHKYLNRVLRLVLRNFYTLTKWSYPLNFFLYFTQYGAVALAMIVPSTGIYFGLITVPAGSDAPTLYLAIFGALNGLFLACLMPSLQLFNTVGPLASYTNRIGELLEILDDLDAQQESNVFQLAASHDYVMLGGYQPADDISLRQVTCRTPDNLLLVQELSFHVGRGQSLLLIGPSGVGKSSVLRVLAGLWPATAGGVVARPATVGADGIFFLPQRPYLNLGTLRDQIIYPRADRGPLNDVDAATLLRRVHLEHLIPELATPDVPWEQRLSGGEQQRLAMARLYYHRPAFAILDECTSAVDADMEAQFYETLREMEVSFISVSHNTNVRAFHDFTLVLLGKGRWRLVATRDLPAGVAIPKESFLPSSNQLAVDASEYHPIDETAAAVQTPGDATNLAVYKFRHQDVDRMLLEQYWPEQTSNQTFALLDTMAAKEQTDKKSALDRRFLKRMWRLVRIGFPAGSRAFNRLIACIFLCLLAAGTSVLAPEIAALATQALVASSRAQFSLDISIVAGAQVVFGLLAGLQLFGAGVLTTLSRKSMMRYLHHRYFSDRTFYNIVCMETGVDNPDQRLADDVRLFTTSFATIFFSNKSLISSTVALVCLLAIYFTTLTWRGPALAFVTSVIGFVLNKLMMNRVVPVVFQQDQVEGDFRYAHIRFRTHCESVAFYGGVSDEHQRLNSSFQRVLGNQLRLLYKQFPLFFVMSAYGTLNIVCAVMLPGIIYFSVGFGGASVLPTYLVIVSAYMNLTSTLSNITGVASDFAALAGHANRLGHMLEVMDALAVARAARHLEVAATGIVEDNTQVAMENVDVVNPLNERLLSNVSFALSAGQSVLIMGPSGCGKSSLLRTLCGLWEPGQGSGSIRRPVHVGRNGIFFLPQKSYLTLGSLLQQVVYPQRAEDTQLNEEGLREILASVQLEHLMERVYGTANNEEQAKQAQWEDLLSGGERQRLGMARLLYHRPAFAVLDESTSAVSEDVEAAFYTKLKELGIGYISVAHRPSVKNYHDRLLIIDTSRHWTLEPCTSS